jgi:hypothetical protein
MIPWKIVIETNLSPDEVCRKLLDVTDTSFNPKWDAYGFAPPKGDDSKLFGGSVDGTSRTFKLYPDPYDAIERFDTRISYQGRAETNGYTRSVVVWVWPSGWEKMQTLMLLIVTIIACYQMFTHEWNEPWTKVGPIMAIPWALFAWITWRGVRKARRVIEELLSGTLPVN